VNAHDEHRAHQLRTVIAMRANGREASIARMTTLRRSSSLSFVLGTQSELIRAEICCALNVKRLRRLLNEMKLARVRSDYQLPRARRAKQHSE